MLVVVAWVDEAGTRDGARGDAGPDDGIPARVRRYLDAHAPATWARVCRQGDGWGIVTAAAAPGSWRWQPLVDEPDLVAVSLGLPVGLPFTTAPALARELLAGSRLSRDVQPPFGLVAVDPRAERLTLAQDWLGMASLYEASADGVRAWSNRPSLLPVALGEPVRPDVAGWATYAGGGYFAEERSPVDGVRILAPGERVDARRTAAGWEVCRSTGENLDAIVADGLEKPGDPVELAAEGLRRVCASAAEYWDGALSLGLSGGKDSRLVAAGLVAAGVTPRLLTRDDDPAEADMARRLVERLRESRGWDPEHRLRPAAAPADVHGVPLLERAVHLATKYDFLFSASYLRRPLVPAWADQIPAPSVTGAMGETVTERWVPHQWKRLRGDEPTADEVRAALLAKIGSDVPVAWQTPMMREVLADVVERRRAHAAAIGLDAVQTMSYVWLAERMRRWSTAVHNPAAVMPLLSPELVMASTVVTPAERFARTVHRGLIDRLVPEWADLPFVRNTQGLRPDQVPRVWHGDGLTTYAGLLEVTGALPGLVERADVDAAVAGAARGEAGTPEDMALQAWLMLVVGQGLLDDLGSGGTGTALRLRRDPALASAAGPARAAVRRAELERRWRSSRPGRAVVGATGTPAAARAALSRGRGLAVRARDVGARRVVASVVRRARGRLGR